MKNKKGFTLVELLAVIVLLGLISTVSITALMKSRKNANIKLAKEMEQSLTKLGEEIYVYETVNGSKDSGSFNDVYKNLKTADKIVITLNELKTAGYLKNLKKDGSNYKFISPESKSKTCDGFIIIKKGPVSQGYINCDNLYETASYNNAKTGAQSVTLTQNNNPETSITE